jgi:hypothetical protein
MNYFSRLEASNNRPALDAGSPFYLHFLGQRPRASEAVRWVLPP